MATSSSNCGVCDLRHIKKPSIVWCTECDEGLCTECQEHHSFSKASRRHKVIAINEYQELPSDVINITQYCIEHNEKFQIYCQKHECPCCSKCVVESHKGCQDIVNLDEAIRDVNTSNALYEIEETLVELAENLQKIHQQKHDNMTTLKASRKEIEKKLKQTRKEINNHLDKLQEDSMKQLYAIEEKENSKICQLLSSLEKTQKEIAECQTKIGNIKTHATDLQMFLSMKQIEKDVDTKDKFLQSLVEGDTMKQISLSYKINTSIQNIMTDILGFGEVRIEPKSCDIVLIKKKTKQAQYMVPPVPTIPIENIKLTLHKTVNTEGDSIFGCCMLPDGRLAFTYCLDWTVKVFTDLGLKDFEVKVSDGVFDIVYNSEDNSLAVSSGGSINQCITIIDLEKKQIRKTISLDSENYGITLNENRLIYSSKDKGIQMINLHDESITVIVQDKMPSSCYTASFKDKIYHTNRATDTVTCYNLQGQLQWTFQNESVLQNPHGIDVDKDGNVYVVGRTSSNVVVISHDGQRHREVIQVGDASTDRTSLHYSRQQHQLLVAEFDTAHVFNLI
ncbi:uncharacterized protein LOC134684028 [Mytilus trossulus]|uniref:uncharacterized protein LOC134684028 n=1 Tax=Mytilus trossulus TaxID=6551 RepID=UPI003007EBB8